MAKVFKNGLDDQLLNMFGGSECADCKEMKLVRDSDHLCIDCWEAAGRPKSAEQPELYKKYWTDDKS